METAEYNYEDFDPKYQNRADEQLLVRFYIKAVEDKPASQREGRIIYKDKEYIEIRTPGRRDFVARPANEGDKQRFPRHYAAFKQRMEIPEEGTPLGEWPMISRSMAEQLSFVSVKTVEQLAELNDSVFGDMKIPGIGELKQRAKDWLEYHKDEKILTQLRTEVEKKDKEIGQLGLKLDKALKEIDKLKAAVAD